MSKLRLFITFLLYMSHVVSFSFYDNPEQDVHSPQEFDRPADLHRKWDFEVVPFI